MYRIIKGHPAYRVGRDGSVWSKKSGVWKKLKLVPAKHGHLSVTLSEPGKKEQHLVHRLVLEAFVGPCPEGMECRHFPDQNPANNNLSNLSWASPKVNQNDRIVNGTRPLGEDVGHSKLTEKKVRRIRELYKTKKYTQYDLSLMFGVSEAAVNFVIIRRTWRHVLD